jgi:hypothetical protein
VSAGVSYVFDLRQSEARQAPLRYTNGFCLEHPMLDIAMLAIGLAFFALSVGYVVACDRL